MSSITTGDNNIAIGFDTLDAVTTQSNNVALGYQALQANTASGNTAVGNQSLKANTTGSSNNAIGSIALLNNTTGNLNNGMGAGALVSNKTGGSNTAVGGNTLTVNTAGNYQTAIGASALQVSGSGVDSLGTITGGSGYTDGTYYDVYLSYQGVTLPYVPVLTEITVASGAVVDVIIYDGGSGFGVGYVLEIDPDNNDPETMGGLLTGSGFTVPVATIITATNNVGIGRRAGGLNSTGSNNTYVGTDSGRLNGGSGNVFLGYSAGSNDFVGSNRLYIDNSNTSTPLIYGDFNANRVKINGDFQLTTKTPASASATGTAGTIAWDADYIYICTATNTWKRASIGGW